MPHMHTRPGNLMAVASIQCPRRRAFFVAGAGVAFPKPSYIRPYIPTKEKGFTTIFIAMNPYPYWCRRDESNTRPSHYE